MPPTEGKNPLDPYWLETYPVHSWDFDSDGCFSLLSLAAMLFDAAGTHAHEMGLAVADLMGDNFTWMLSRFSVALENQPRRRDTITIKTWPTGIERLSALRNFEITSSDGARLGAASSSWLVIDRASRRPVRVEPFLQKFSPDLTFPPGSDSSPKIPELEYPGHESQFPVRWSDIDFNGHATSASYIGWALDDVPPEFRKGRTIAGFAINYRAETFFGESVISQSQEAVDGSGTLLHRIISMQDGRELARARSVWRMYAEGNKLAP